MGMTVNVSRSFAVDSRVSVELFDYMTGEVHRCVCVNYLYLMWF